MASSIILSSPAFPPISVASLIYGSKVIIDTNEHFVKQSYRNRYYILGPNGIVALTIPALKWRNHTPVKDIRIDYRDNWQQLHWKSITSAYNNSPFFEFYKDDFHPLFVRKTEYLHDWNMAALEVISAIVDKSPKIEISEVYVDPDVDQIDLRSVVSPKKDFSHPKIDFQFDKYPQVFSDRFSFAENLSVIDLIFNLGPQASSYLNNCCAIHPQRK